MLHHAANLPIPPHPGRVGLLGALLILSACSKPAQDAQPSPAATPAAPSAATAATDSPLPTETQWARAALERNPQLEVLATDTDAGVFTVRNRQSGTVQAVHASELAAVPIADLAAPASGPMPESPPDSTAQTAATDTVAQGAESDTGYTIERQDGRVRVTGPGVSIESSPPAATLPAAAPPPARRNEPLICEGVQRMHLDNRRFDIEGTAVIARKGCELYVTNSEISATGLALDVQDAVVHVANSRIEGRAGSVRVLGRGKVYARSSTFVGLSTRGSEDAIQDQGGNQWR